MVHAVLGGLLLLASGCTSSPPPPARPSPSATPVTAPAVAPSVAPVTAQLPIHQGPVLAVAVSPDGSLVASGGADKKVIITRLADRQQQAVLNHPSEVRALAFDPQGLGLTTVTDGAVFHWSMAEGQQQQTRFDISKGSVILAPDGHTVASVDNEKVRISVWDCLSGRLLKVTRLGNRHMKRSITSGAFSSDGTFLVLAGQEQRGTAPAYAQTWTVTLSMGGRGEAPTFGNDGSKMDGIAVTPDDRVWVMVTSDANQTWHVYAHASGVYQPTELETAARTPLRQVLIGPSGSRILLVGEETRLYDVPTIPVPLQTVPADDESPAAPATPHAVVKTEARFLFGKGILSAAFTPDRSTVVTGNEDGQIRLYAIGATPVTSSR